MHIKFVSLLTPTSPCINVHMNEFSSRFYLFTEWYINPSPNLSTLAERGFKPTTEPNSKYQANALPTELSCLDILFDCDMFPSTFKSFFG